MSGYAAKNAEAPLAPYFFERRKPPERDVGIELSSSLFKKWTRPMSAF